MSRKKKIEDPTPQFYSLDRIHEVAKKKNAKYIMVFGQRSNGKTFAVKKEMLLNFWNNKKQSAYIRRYKEDVTGYRAETLFDDISGLGLVHEITGGRWDGVKYRARKWYLCRHNEDGDIEETSEDPFCYGFALSENEHDKSRSLPKITLICFDEFLSRSGYLPDEFVLFMNTLSTIIRTRSDVTIYMLGNTINKYCPYFKEMGLKHAKDLKISSIESYSYGNSDLTVVVEHADIAPATKRSTHYFAFDNPKLSMITGGEWELDIYPHAPYKFTGEHIKYKFYICFEDYIIEGNIVYKEGDTFLFYHEKTTPLKNLKTDLVYQLEPSPKPNVFQSIKKNYNPICHKIGLMMSAGRAFYQNNDVGEVVHNYLLACDNI